jgi:hypothetical protein
MKALKNKNKKGTPKNKIDKPVSERKPSKNSIISMDTTGIRKQLLLFGIAIGLLFLYYSIGENRRWFNNKLLGYWEEFKIQKKEMDPEKRKNSRLGTSYSLSKTFADFLINKGERDKLLLLPPNDYLLENKIQYKVPEPVVFYYYTGLKTVWPDNNDAMKAAWYVDIVNGQITLDSVKNQAQLDSVLIKFRKYKSNL